ncbi:helix-turn-helix domain-containing protein [Nocardia sp. NPDC050406]|uniref:helix-turn-helix domain-containing protein n=1 Tax=Nocardia sp. NPDC050406 TaxID=3364318 RepID=UPI0037B86128
MPTGKTGAVESSPPTRRVISVVELLTAHHSSMTAAEIADTLDLNRSTVGAILAALGDSGWVRRLPDLSYELGPALAAIGHRATAAQRDWEWLHAELERLAARVGCGAALTAITGEELEFLAVTRDRGLVPGGIEAGIRFPLLAPAGAAIIAHAGAARQRDWLETAVPERRADYAAVLETLRTEGYSAWRLAPDSIPTLRVLADVVDHLAEHPTSKDLRGRVLALLATVGGAPYDPATMNGADALPLSYLSAPVFDAEGHAAMELQIGPLRSAVTRAERLRYIEELTAAAGRLGAERSTFQS